MTQSSSLKLFQYRLVANLWWFSCDQQNGGSSEPNVYHVSPQRVPVSFSASSCSMCHCCYCPTYPYPFPSFLQRPLLRPSEEGATTRSKLPRPLQPQQCLHRLISRERWIRYYIAGILILAYQKRTNGSIDSSIFVPVGFFCQGSKRRRCHDGTKGSQIQQASVVRFESDSRSTRCWRLNNKGICR